MLGNKSVFLHSEYSSSFHRILVSQQNRARTSLRFSSYELSLPSLSLVGVTKSFSHVLQALHFFSRLFEPVAIDFLWVCLARGSTVMFFKSSAIPSLFVFIFVFSIIQLVDNLVDKILPNEDEDINQFFQYCCFWTIVSITIIVMKFIVGLLHKGFLFWFVELSTIIMLLQITNFKWSVSSTFVRTMYLISVTEKLL